MENCLRMGLLAFCVSAFAAACGSDYDMSNPPRVFAAAFTGVDAVYDVQLTSYAATFGTADNSNLSLVRIVLANSPNLCANLTAQLNPPGTSRIILLGYVDGDVMQTVPSTTWSQVYDDLPVDPTKIDTMDATLYGFDSTGEIESIVNMLTGTTTFASDGNDAGVLQIKVAYDFVPDVGGSPLNLSDPGIPASWCVN